MDVLLIDDDKAFLGVLCKIFEEAGYAPTACASGRAGLEKAFAKPPALIVLDLVMPGLKGLEICQALKQRPETAGVPVLILTGNDGDGLDIACLDMGADDYLTKPIGGERLLAHCRALLRRSGKHAAEDVVVGGLKLDYPRKLAWLDGKQVSHLTPREFELLYYLASRSPQPSDRASLYQHVWGSEAPSKMSLRTVEVHVRRIRLKLGLRSDRCLITVPGRGYAVA